MHKLIPCALAVVAASGAAAAQRAVLPVPLHPTGPDADTRGVVARPDLDLVSSLAALEDGARLEGLLLPSGELADLELERISVERRRFGFQVDGVARPDLLAGLDLSVWHGRVVGDPSSSVMLGFSNAGVRGWIQRGRELVHLVPRPDGAGDWRSGDVLIVTEERLSELGLRPDFACAAEAPVREALPPSAPSPPGGSHALGSCDVLECTIAMETDYQLFQVFGDLAAQTAYVTTLLSWISFRYEEQIGTVLTYPYLRFYTNENDPWNTPDNGGNSITMLNEFVAAWQGNVPMGATLAHFMSGASLGGGVAYLDVLCSSTHNFAVSGNINGDVAFPVQQQPSNWDFMVVAHEIGHNFATPHTHDYCPPLDRCAPQGYFGSCQTQQVCTNMGTIMSYCHLCDGGTANITTYFHPTVVVTMRGAAESCLFPFSGIAGERAPIFDPYEPTALTARVAGTPVGPVELHYRFDGGAFSSVAMSPLEAPGSYSGEVPAAPCGAEVEYYYSFTEAACGPASDPSGAPGALYTGPVGVIALAFADDFEKDTGWFETNLGATSGDWERGVPVNDPNWAYDPVSDYDGSGSCYLTENALGNTDVDDGAVRVTSPALDFTGDGLVISYAYFLRLTNQNGADRLLVEVSANGLEGPWTEIARHDTNGGLAWRTHAITAQDLAAAGVVPSADSRLRFTANDANPQSIVEAALDAFVVSRLECVPAGIGTSYCTSLPNSTGAAALLSAQGSASIGANDLTLTSMPVPNQTGLFFYGPTQVELPFGDGFRCVGGSPVRLDPPQPAADHVATRAVDLVLEGFAPGQSVNFQHWYRDPEAGLTGFNLSDGLELTFAP